MLHEIASACCVMPYCGEAGLMPTAKLQHNVQCHTIIFDLRSFVYFPGIGFVFCVLCFVCRHKINVPRIRFVANCQRQLKTK